MLAQQVNSRKRQNMLTSSQAIHVLDTPAPSQRLHSYVLFFQCKTMLAIRNEHNLTYIYIYIYKIYGIRRPNSTIDKGFTGFKSRKDRCIICYTMQCCDAWSSSCLSCNTRLRWVSGLQLVGSGEWNLTSLSLLKLRNNSLIPFSGK